MGELDLRAERDHVHPRHLLADDPAFQSGVNRLDLRLGPEFSQVDALDHLQESRAEVGIPPRICLVFHYRRAGEHPAGPNAPAESLESGVNRGAAAEPDHDGPVPHLHRRQVRAGLDQIGDVIAHRHDAVRKRVEQMEQCCASRITPDVPSDLGVRNLEGHPGIGTFEFRLDEHELVPEPVQERCFVRPADDGCRERLARYGAVRAAAFEAREAERCARRNGPQRARQQLHGVAVLQVDVTPRVPAL